MDRRLMNTTYLQGRIQDLHKLHNVKVEEYGELVTSLTKECEIYCELIPGYRITAKLESAAEGAPRQKKEVYNIERLEHDLLTQYEHFLQLLRKLQHKSHPEQQALGSRMCAKLISESSAADFNHSETLVTMGVRFANAKSTRVAKPCMDALQGLLDGRMIDECTQHVVQSVLAIVRQQHHALNPKILNLLLFIRVAMIDHHRKDITEEKAKNKKLKKKDKEIARQMQKANARQDRAELSVKQMKIIHSVFVIYLRVLQASQNCTQSHQTKILAPALEGLAKFAPLVNMEHYQLLMKALRELVDDEDTGVTTTLHALVAVACLAQKDVMLDASEWRVDLTHFHEVLYRSIGSAMAPPDFDTISGKKEEEQEDENNKNSDTASQGSTSTAGTLSSVAFSIAQSMANHRQTQQSLDKEWGYRAGLVVRAIDLLILSQKFVPVIRVIAFCRRLILLGSVAPANINMSVTSLVHRLFLRYPGATSTVIGGNDNYLAGKGNFDPEAEELNASNSDCNFSWELSLLQQSYHPTVRDISSTFVRHYHKVSKVQSGAAPVVTKQLDSLGPYEVLERYDSSFGDIQPPPQHPERRPAAKQHQKNKAAAAAAAAANSNTSALTAEILPSTGLMASLQSAVKKERDTRTKPEDFGESVFDAYKDIHGIGEKRKRDEDDVGTPSDDDDDDDEESEDDDDSAEEDDEEEE